MILYIRISMNDLRISLNVFMDILNSLMDIYPIIIFGHHNSFNNGYP